jgi:hypothetical protein
MLSEPAGITYCRVEPGDCYNSCKYPGHCWVPNLAGSAIWPDDAEVGAPLGAAEGRRGRSLI